MPTKLALPEWFVTTTYQTRSGQERYRDVYLRAEDAPSALAEAADIVRKRSPGARVVHQAAPVLAQED